MRRGVGRGLTLKDTKERCAKKSAEPRLKFSRYEEVRKVWSPNSKQREGSGMTTKECQSERWFWLELAPREIDLFIFDGPKDESSCVAEVQSG